MTSTAPDPAGGAYSAPPDPLAGFGGLLLRRGKGREGRGGEGKGGKGGGEGKGHEPPHYLEEVYAYGAPPLLPPNPGYATGVYSI